MKRLAFAGALVACGVAPLSSRGVHQLLEVPAFVCRFIPAPIMLAGLAIVLLVLIALACLVALRLTHRTRRAISELSVDVEHTPDRLLTIARRAGLRKDFWIVDCPDFIAFTHGLARPRVFLSRDLYECLDDAELEAVLRHEGAHAQRHDPLRVLIARALGTVFAFVPFARPALQTYLCRLELAADRVTVAAMSDVLPLASALQRVMLRQPHRDLAAVAVSGLSATDVRIDHLLGIDTSPALIPEPANRLHLALFWLTALAISCVLLTSAFSVARIGLCVAC